MEEAKSLGYQLAQTLKVFLNQAAIEFKNRNIEVSFEQYVMLRLVEADPNIIQKDIALHLKKDKSLVVRQMDNLMEKEYIVRIPNGEDKRKKNLIITAKGQELMNKIAELNSEISEVLIEGVSEDKYQCFLFVLNKIQENGKISIDLASENKYTTK